MDSQNIINKYLELKKQIIIQNNEAIVLNNSIKKLNIRLENINNIISEKENTVAKYLVEFVKKKEDTEILNELIYQVSRSMYSLEDVIKDKQNKLNEIKNNF
jgi:hypothetical protein